ncbi:MAG: hypothetical protein JWP69_926 [Flaviaesturariibacter sp.]|nr:hypothetical protein [Flaviaesturariibacter sp.]
MIYLSALILFFSPFAGASPDMPMPVAVISGMAPTTLDKTLLLKLVNEARGKGVQCGDVWYPPVAPLSWNIQLEAAATLHSADMFRKKYFSHIEDDGSTANTRIEKAGYIWMTYGENIAFGYATEKDVVDGWLKSPGHCKNIMNKAFKEVGIGRVGDYWTQDFGSK